MGSIYFTYNIDPDLYYDIEGLDGTIQINVPLAITNAEDYTLWFKIELIGPSAGYTLYSQDLGSLDSGISAYFVFNIQRDLPTLTDGELDEELTIRITAYTDSEYSVVYGYKESVSTIHFSDSYDGNWTLLYHDTFDDATTDDWTTGSEVIDSTIYIGYYMSMGVGINTGSFLSAPYALTIEHYYNPPYTDGPFCVKKTFTVTGTKARITIHLKWEGTYMMAIKIEDKLYVPQVIGALIPINKWIRLTFPLPIGTPTVYITHNGNTSGLVIDEIRVISK